jgi:hypothetical protein
MDNTAMTTVFITFVTKLTDAGLVNQQLQQKSKATSRCARKRGATGHATKLMHQIYHIISLESKITLFWLNAVICAFIPFLSAFCCIEHFKPGPSGREGRWRTLSIGPRRPKLFLPFTLTELRHGPRVTVRESRTVTLQARTVTVRVTDCE